MDTDVGNLSWIVGVDGSPGAEAALHWAVVAATDHVADRGGSDSPAGVTPVCAWHVPLALRALAGRRVLDVDRMGLRAEAVVAATETVRAVAASRPQAPAPDDLVVVEGHPTDVLLERSGPGTTVVVGRRGSGELRHRLVGSVSRDLVTGSGGPVVVVPETWQARAIRRIVVGFDGSAHSRSALRWALDNAHHDAQVCTVAAFDIVPWLNPVQVAERFADEVAAERARIDAAVRTADPTGRSEVVLALHAPQQALAEETEGADLVVVGPRGHGGLAGLLLGSVTAWLLHASACPVAVVPGSDADVATV